MDEGISCGGSSGHVGVSSSSCTSEIKFLRGLALETFFGGSTSYLSKFIVLIYSYGSQLSFEYFDLWDTVD